MEKKKFWIIRNQIRDLLVDGLFTLTSVRMWRVCGCMQFGSSLH